jgi:hypothetical protein
MVDSIKPSGTIQNALSVGKSQKIEDEKKATPSSAAPVDEVKFSPEALSLNEATTSAQQARESLTEQPLTTLSDNAERLNTLV